MPALFLNAGAACAPGVQQRLYLDESGTLSYGGELFTMAMVLVHDLPKLEACTLKHRTTQSEVKASQMKTAQKLALAKTLLEENDIAVYLVKLDPAAAMACERKLDKDFLYDSMVAQALAHYLQEGDLARNLPYRISMDMRGGLRESHEDVVGESVATVLMHREEPLVSGIDVRFLDSRYSAGVQAADLFSNIYRTSLTQTDSPCTNFLQKFEEAGRVHSGFSFGLPELADQMTQIANDLRARVEYERLASPQAAPAEKPGAEAEPAEAVGASEAQEAPQAPAAPSERRSRRTRRKAPASEAVEAATREPGQEAPADAENGAPANEPTATEDVLADAGGTDEPPTIVLPFAPQGMGTSRSARRRRARAARREREALETSEPAAVEDSPQPTAEEPALSVAETNGEPIASDDAPATEAEAPKAAATPSPDNAKQAHSEAMQTGTQPETAPTDAQPKATTADAGDAAETTAVPDKRPGRASRARSRKADKPKAAAETPAAPKASEATPAETAATPVDAPAPVETDQAAPAEKPKRRRRAAAKKQAEATDAATSDAVPAEPAAPEGAEETPAPKKAPRKRTRKAAAPAPLADDVPSV